MGQLVAHFSLMKWWSIMAMTNSDDGCKGTALCMLKPASSFFFLYFWGALGLQCHLLPDFLVSVSLCGTESQPSIAALGAQSHASGAWPGPMRDVQQRAGWLAGWLLQKETSRPCFFSFFTLADSCLSSAAYFHHTFAFGPLCMLFMLLSTTCYL